MGKHIDKVYICGPPNMNYNLINALRSINYEENKISIIWRL